MLDIFCVCLIKFVSDTKSMNKFLVSHISETFREGCDIQDCWKHLYIFVVVSHRNSWFKFKLDLYHIMYLIIVLQLWRTLIFVQCRWKYLFPFLFSVAYVLSFITKFVFLFILHLCNFVYFVKKNHSFVRSYPREENFQKILCYILFRLIDVLHDLVNKDAVFVKNRGQ